MTTANRKFPVETLSPSEVHALLKRCSPRCPTGLRNRALIVCLWRCGLRISEALSLRPKDIESSSIRVLDGKGGKFRIVGIDVEAMAVIERWVAERKRLGISGTRPLFCTLRGGAIAGAYVRNMLKRVARKANIEKRVHPHCLRHTHATELCQEGVNVGIISKQLGHSSIATTARYLDHISPRQVIETMSNRTWSV
jgi:site-specific recombinase XerD